MRNKPRIRTLNTPRVPSFRYHFSCSIAHRTDCLRLANNLDYGAITSASSSRMAADADTKSVTDEILDDVVKANEHDPAHGKIQPPPLVAAMSQEYRAEAEARLRKKIDTRLLPMIILMYIMNYLDRNNIAAVRLAGLQDELNLSSTQYQVSLHFIFASSQIAAMTKETVSGSGGFLFVQHRFRS